METPKMEKLLQAKVDEETQKKLRVIAMRAGGCSQAELMRIIVKKFIKRFEEQHGEVAVDEQLSLD